MPKLASLPAMYSPTVYQMAVHDANIRREANCIEYQVLLVDGYLNERLLVQRARCRDRIDEARTIMMRFIV